MALVGFGLILSRVVSSLRFFTLSLCFSPLFYQLSNNLFLPGTKKWSKYQGSQTALLERTINQFYIIQGDLFFHSDAVQNWGPRINCWVFIKRHPVNTIVLLFTKLVTKYSTLKTTSTSLQFTVARNRTWILGNRPVWRYFWVNVK